MKLLLSVALALALAPPIGAFEQTRSIQLDVSGIKLEQLARNFADMADAALVAPRDLLETTVSVMVENVRWQTALTVVCDLADCAWRLEGEGEARELRLEPRSTSEPGPLDERVTVHTNAASAVQMLESVARIQGAISTIDPAIEGTVTARIGDVRLSTALDVICESGGCHWLVEDGAIVARRAQPLRADWPTALAEEVSISLVQAEACSVAEVLARIGGTSFACPDHLRPHSVTIEVQNLPAYAALDHLAASWDSRWRVESGNLIVEPLEAHGTAEPDERVARLEKKVSLDLVQAPACDVLGAIGRILELDVSCHAFLDARKVSIRVDEITGRELLDRLCQDWGCHWSVGARGLFLEQNG